MRHRYAILGDNERVLRARIARLRTRLASLLPSRACAALVIGSVAEGRAHDRSDIDLLVVLREGLPRRSDYDWWEREVAPALGDLAREPFPVQPIFVGRSALATSEPNLRGAIRSGVPLWDPEGLFGDQSEPRS